MDYAAARFNMVESQLRTNKVTNTALLEAFEAVPRERFLGETQRAVAYVDEDLAVGPERYLMEPMVLARLLQAAAVEPGDMVLEVGTGTGYGAAILARLAGTVVALEDDATLAAQAEAAFEALGIDNVVLVSGALSEGYPKQAPYNVIVLDGAVATVPDGICDQLAEGGRLVTVVRQDGGPGRAVLMQRSGGHVSSRVLFDAATPYLPGFKPDAGFVF